MEILKKMFNAKKEIALTKEKKLGKNTYSNYDYFTPEQVKKLVDEVCFENKLLTMFRIENNYAYLTIYDIESEEKLEVSTPIEIPEIKATNGMQRIGGVITYAERYLKMTAFGIVDNNLDFDTTENTEKIAKNTNKIEPEKWLNEKDKQGNITPEWENIIKGIVDKKITSVADARKYYKIAKTTAEKIQELINQQK